MNLKINLLLTDLLWATRLLINVKCFCWICQSTFYINLFFKNSGISASQIIKRSKSHLKNSLAPIHSYETIRNTYRFGLPILVNYFYKTNSLIFYIYLYFFFYVIHYGTLWDCSFLTSLKCSNIDSGWNGYCSSRFKSIVSPAPSSLDSVLTKVARMRTRKRNKCSWQWKATCLTL